MELGFGRTEGLPFRLRKTNRACLLCMEGVPHVRPRISSRNILTFAEAYDIKLIMNKGMFDIIRPRWLLDSIANKELAPMLKKYFLHATAERMESEDYNDEDEDEDGIERRSLEEGALRKSDIPGTHVIAEKSEPKEEDSDMQDWLQVEPDSNVAENLHDDAESVTDPDSDNEDNWFSVEAPQLGGAPASETEVSL